MRYLKCPKCGKFSITRKPKGGLGEFICITRDCGFVPNFCD